MPRYNVEVDGKWACFSSIVDWFVTPFMPLEEYEKWRDEEYGKQKAPIDQSNKMSITEAIYDMSLDRTDEEIIVALREMDMINNGAAESEDKSDG